MAAWPELDELKQVLDADPNSTVWDGDGDNTRLTRLLAAAIRTVKVDVAGSEDEFDEDPGDPDENLAQAALRIAELLALKPELASAAKGDPTYQRLLFGQRRSFGVSG